MSEMKCPFCQQELRKIHPTYVICDNCRITGEDKLWQELIRTRKALDVAVDALKDIRYIYTGDQTTKPSAMFGRAAGALNKITALEQKDKR